MTDSELNGTCRNPWDPTLTPGGSSGGAAAALAAGLCAVSHGTDGAGSVRNPASFCGLVGLKPTRGLSSSGPETGNAYYGTTVDGVLTRSVRDAAAMLDVLVGPRRRPVVVSPVGAALRPGGAGRPAPAAYRGDHRCARSAPPGNRVRRRRARPPTSSPAWATTSRRRPRDWNVILAAERGADVGSRTGGARRSGPARPGRAAQPSADRTPDDTDGVGASRWVDEARAASARFLPFWDRYDLLVTPTAGILPPPTTWAPWDQEPDAHMATFMEFPNFAQPFNVSGQPAVSVPIAWSADGLPIGVQLAGRRLDEALLLRVARQLETARPWSDRRPAAFA